VTSPVRTRTGPDLLEFFRSLGLDHLHAVRLRENRRTIWSLTRNGTVLNLHTAYSRAPDSVLRNFGVIVGELRLRAEGAREVPGGARAMGHGRARSRLEARDAAVHYRDARTAVRDWEGLRFEILRIRAGSEGEPSGARRRRAGFARGRKGGAARERGGAGACCGTPAQREYLHGVYRSLNEERFGGKLPETVFLRLSNRMRSRLGHMRPGREGGGRRIVEIALNVDLMLESNAEVRVDTLLHEMAHAAEWLEEGRIGHGSGWKRWARQVGCLARACTPLPFASRPAGERTVTRVPPVREGLDAGRASQEVRRKAAT